MARRHGLILALAWAALAAPAQAAPVFTIYGAGPEDLRPGVLAAEAGPRQMPIELAAAADGRIAFTTSGAVWTLRGARLVRVPTPPGDARELGFSPSGDLFVASCPEGAGQLHRVAPDRAPVLIAGRPGTSETAGDGGPALAAAFECPRGFDFAADGAILLADSVAHRVRRIGPDGSVSTLAGVKPPPTPDFELPEPAGDGGPASAAVLSSPADVAVLSGGAFAVLDAGKIRVVGPDGVIRPTNAPEAIAIAADPAGLLILEESGRLWRRSPDGSLAQITGFAQERAGITPYIPVANDPFGPGDPAASDVVASPDGGVLLSADFAIHYVPPPVPALLAVAIRPATRVPARGLTVSVTTTGPAQVRIGVWRSGRRAALVTTQVAAGETAIPIPSVTATGLHRIHVQAADHDDVASASASVLVGGRLPIAYARSFLRGRLDLFETFSDAEHVSLRCVRMAAGRVDCRMRDRRGRCAGIASLRVERDGSLTVWQYDGGKRCRFSRERGAPPTRRGPGSQRIGS